MNLATLSRPSFQPVAIAMAALVAASTMCSFGAAQDLVKDINPAPFEAGSSPRGGLTLDTGPLYFGAETEDGYGVFKAFGTTETTILLKLFRGATKAPSEFAAVRWSVFFAAEHDGDVELWRSHGSANSTAVVADLNPNGPSHPQNLTSAGNLLYFTADNGADGVELWVTAQTGTPKLVKDIHATGSSSPSGLVAFGNKLVFSADDGVHGRELWITDGTARNTEMIADIRSGSEGALSDDPDAKPVVVGRDLFFPANDGTSGKELWKLDQKRVVSLVADPDGASKPTLLRAFNGRVYYRAGNRHLWSSDGTSAGTGLVASFSGSLDKLSVVGDKLYFAADSDKGIEPWVSDGTTAGTTLLRDIETRAQSGSNPRDFQQLGNRVVFSAKTNASGRELYVSDGTTAGTQLVVELNAGSESGVESLLGLLKDKMLFSGDDGKLGWELYETDGTAAGTRLLNNLYHSSRTADSNPTDFVKFGTSIYFVASDEFGDRELWRTDGSRNGTVRVKDIRTSGSSSPADLVVFDSKLFFTADDGTHERELWTTDGTESGTVLVKDIKANGASGPSELTVVGDSLYFAANDGLKGRELWKTDGTAAGTVLVKDIKSTGGSLPESLTNVDGTLFFVAKNDEGDTHLWMSDGTSDGTKEIENNSSIGSSSPEQLTTVGKHVLFTAHTLHGREVHWYDGKEAEMVWDIRSGLGKSSSPEELTAVGTSLFFAATDGTKGVELYVSPYVTRDEAYNRAWLLKDIHPTGSSSPRDLVAMGRRVFFAATDPVHGNELWTSDGTSAGTVLVADLLVGTESSKPRDLTVIGDTLFFSADDGSTGRELWKSDGTQAGTVRVVDLHAAADSSPGAPIQGHGALFFAADDGEHGRELFSMSNLAFELYGEGCRGTDRLRPTIGYAGVPRIGTSFDIDLVDANKLSGAVLLVGVGRAEIALPPAGKCHLYVQSTAMMLNAATSASGGATVRLALPNDRDFVGKSVAAQWFVFDPNGPFLGQLTSSNALEAVFGL